MSYPLTFKPIYKERLWGGRALEELYGKTLPANLPIGESWEISDRPGDISVVEAGPWQGRDLHWLVENQSEALLGDVPLVNGRFPLLIKILDAQETLSLQVHPPASAATRLEGEPKTEVWYLAAAKPGAELYAGLRRGVTRGEFEQKLRTGAVAECFHRIPVQPGDAMFVPSGRVHGIGAGCVIFEVQQNSDTTYRVFDWNRFGPDGKARELHIPQSLESIDFGDYEPGLIASQYEGPGGAPKRLLVDNEYFRVEARRLETGSCLGLDGLCIIGVLSGTVQIAQQGSPLLRSAGQFALLPASLRQAPVQAAEPAEFLVIGAK